MIVKLLTRHSLKVSVKKSNTVEELLEGHPAGRVRDLYLGTYNEAGWNPESYADC